MLSIKSTIERNEPKKNSSFGNKYDAYEHIMYKGQENHFYGREGAPPGSYNVTESNCNLYL